MIMAEAQRGDDDIFVYMGGNQVVPGGVRRARIHKSVKIVRARAFRNRWSLISVEFHDGVEIIEEGAFYCCYSLKGPIKLLGVKIIKKKAFQQCPKLTDVEFGDKLETIGKLAFNECNALEKIMMPSVRIIGEWAFSYCSELIDVEFGEGLMTIQQSAICGCYELKRVVLPLKDDMIEDGAFDNCQKLTAVDLVGGVQNTVVSLHLESWRNEMTDEINHINQTLSTAAFWQKTRKIRQWMETVIRRLNHFKAEHHLLLKEATTLLELALWKANLDGNGGDRIDREGVRTTRGIRKRARKEICVTSGASIVIKNVLPFLALKS